MEACYTHHNHHQRSNATAYRFFRVDTSTQEATVVPTGKMDTDLS